MASDALLLVGEYPLSPLLGRERELSALDDWLARSTEPMFVVGEGGSGKSALAATWALADERASRVVWYSLYAANSTLPDFVDVASSALAAPSASHVDRLETLVATLRARRAIVVLDGLERAFGSVAGEHFHDPLALPTLRALFAAELPVLVTTRTLPPGLAHDEIEVLDVETLQSPAIFEAITRPRGPVERTPASLLALAGSHALTAKLFAGCLRADPSFDITDVAAHERRTTIFEAAQAALPEGHQRSLVRLSIFGRALPTEQILPLIEGEDDEARREVLALLADRGLLLYARGRTVDIHPVVRDFLAKLRTRPLVDEVLSRVTPRPKAQYAGTARVPSDLDFEVELFGLFCEVGRLAKANVVVRDVNEELLRMGLGSAERRSMLARLFGMRDPSTLTERDVEALVKAGLPIDAISARANDLAQVVRLLGDQAGGEALARWTLALDIRTGCTAFNFAAALSTTALAVRSYREKDALVSRAELAIAIAGRAEPYYSAHRAWICGELGDREGFDAARERVRATRADSADRLVAYGAYELAIGAGEDCAEADAALEALARVSSSTLIAQNLAGFRAERALLESRWIDADRAASEAYSLAGRACRDLDRIAAVAAAAAAGVGDLARAHLLLTNVPARSDHAKVWAARAWLSLGRRPEALALARAAWASLHRDGERWAPCVARRALTTLFETACEALPPLPAATDEPLAIEAIADEMLGALERQAEHQRRPLGSFDFSSEASTTSAPDDAQRIQPSSPRVLRFGADAGWLDARAPYPPCDAFVIEGVLFARGLVELAPWLSERVRTRALVMRLIPTDEACASEVPAALARLVTAAGASELRIAVNGPGAVASVTAVVEALPPMERLRLESHERPNDVEEEALSAALRARAGVSIVVAMPLSFWAKDRLRREGHVHVV